MSEKNLENRLNEAFLRIQTLEGKAPTVSVSTSPPNEKWLKRNAYWFFPTLAVGVALIVGSGLLALVSGSFVDGRIDGKLGGPLGRIGTTETGVTRIETKLDTFLEFLRPLIAERLRRAASLPSDQLPKDLPQIKAAVGLARQQQIRGQEEPVRTLGKRAIDLAKARSGISDLAWQTATEILNYKSFLNVTPQSALPVGPLPPGRVWKYEAPRIPGKTAPTLGFTKNFGVPIQQAARLDRIGEDKNSALTQGPLFLIATGGAFSLDNQHIRNTVFDNVEIHYSGRPVILENIFFVNCTFVLENTVPGRKLGEEMLASSGVNFKDGA